MSRKAAVHALEHLQKEFPSLRAGQWNCRYIGNDPDRGWSTHAWGAGLDISHKDWGYSTNPVHQAWLDSVALWLEQYRYELSIKVMLWRVADHYNHIHVDFWWHDDGDPPCDGGVLEQVNSQGLHAFGDQGPENGYWEGPGMGVYEDYVAGIVTGYAEDATWFRMQLERLKAEDKFGGSIDYWVDLLTDPHNPAWLGFYSRTEMSTW